MDRNEFKLNRTSGATLSSDDINNIFEVDLDGDGIDFCLKVNLENRTSKSNSGYDQQSNAFSGIDSHSQWPKVPKDSSQTSCTAQIGQKSGNHTKLFSKEQSDLSLWT